VEYGSAGKHQIKFHCKFSGTVSSTRGIHELTKKVRSTQSLLYNKPARKCHVLTEEKLDETGARSEDTPQKSVSCLAQETGI
jgi:hypothetical protein